jgi:hypothetical protein
MNFTAGMDIEFQQPLPLPILLAALLEAGWSYQAEGEIRLLPLLCSSPRDWATRPAAGWCDVQQEMAAKQRNRETAGLVLHWQERGYACAFHIFPDGDLSVDFGTKRATLVKCESLTDTGWYIVRIVCPLIVAGGQVDTIRYSEVRAVGSPWDTAWTAQLR